MRALLRFADGVRALLQRIGEVAGWLFVACTLVICFDVVTRKFGYQLPGFGSTRLQELEWHFHTALFSLWLGLAYLKNAHVRIDIAVARLAPRRQAWVELIGCFVFALPYCLVAVYFSGDFAWIAWNLNESSDAASGLPYRVVPKGIIFIGLLLLLAAVLAVMARLVVFIWGPAELRKNAQFAGARVETT